jgi:propanol-preferring alcohol dehydrogenase
MQAFRLMGWQRPPELVEVPVPTPGPQQVLVRVGGVGLCHTDIHFFDVPAGVYDYRLPFTLGHEISGWVHELGPGVDDLRPGDGVLASAHFWCGQCRNCLRGHDNYCLRHSTGLGYGADGGLAEFVVVDRHSLVPLAGVDPRSAGPLADAGNTAYHAVKKVLPKLVPGSRAVLIGVGGLGGYAVQFLRLLSGAEIVAVDTAPHRLTRADALGAHRTVLAGDDLAAQLREATGGEGADVVLDLVGSDATMAAALSASRPLGAVALIGAAMGTARVSWPTVARECEVFIPQGGTMPDLEEVVALAASGSLVSDSQTFAFSEVEQAYARLRAGDLVGRAVVVMP